MNSYIIDPAVFYWINVLSIVQTVLAVLGSFILVGCISLIVTYFVRKYMLEEPEEPDIKSEYDKNRYKRQLKSYKDELRFIATVRKWAIVTGIVGLCMVLASVFIPGKQTSVEMLVARTATYDNVNWTVAQVKEVIDYIVSALKGAV